MDEVRSSLRKQREGLSVQDVLSKSKDKVEKVEAAIAATQEAELPFLKGVEVLPPEEAPKAIADCEDAISKAEKVINDARSFVKSKSAESRKYSKDLAKRLTDELADHLKRADAATKRLSEFKKSTVSRKTAAILAESTGKISDAEKKVAAFKEAGRLFSSEDLGDVSSEKIKEAMEGAGAAEREASAACV